MKRKQRPSYELSVFCVNTRALYIICSHGSCPDQKAFFRRRIILAILLVLLYHAVGIIDGERSQCILCNSAEFHAEDNKDNMHKQNFSCFFPMLFWNLASLHNISDSTNTTEAAASVTFYSFEKYC